MSPKGRGEKLSPSHWGERRDPCIKGGKEIRSRTAPNPLRMKRKEKKKKFLLDEKRRA